MLTIHARHSIRLKCPRHPRMQYVELGRLPASCAACARIADVVRASRAFEGAVARAERSIAEAEMHRALNARKESGARSQESE